MSNNKKYSIIYADPPWSYNDKRGASKHGKKHGGVNAHYQTMSKQDIMNLDVQSVSADNCMLFMWVTFPNLQQGLDTIKAWGFKYKTLGFSWIKTNRKNGKPFFGIGWYTKSNCEVCLIGVKGKPFKSSNSVSSVLIEPLDGHSKKPDEARKRIVEFCGDLPRLEMFARTAPEGWDVFGNETPNSIDIPIKE
jgi:site-specific DNA-methyltransferase (adenine-specific)